LSFSGTRIDTLGDSLRKQLSIADSDVELLDEFRRSFGAAYDFVLGKIREELQIDVTGRPAKTILSIVSKLRRETIRLSQMQDIAGCRIVVDNIGKQDIVLANLQDKFPGSDVVDRRLHPSHSYRAVHIIVHIYGKTIEIQLRTRLQHMWAELSEKWSDTDPALKYGGGKTSVQDLLKQVSDLVKENERLERHPQISKDAANRLRETISNVIITIGEKVKI
jgi:putative GTP pyrophosphokinase